MGRPEGRSGIHRIKRTKGCTSAVSGIDKDRITPPNLDGVDSNRSVLRELKTEEDDNNGARKTSIESGRENVIVLAPPGKVTPPNHILENESNQSPWHVVNGRSWRNSTSSREDDWEVDVFEDRVGVLASDEVRNPRSDCTKKEEEGESVVDLSMRELECWTNDSPNDRCCSEHLSAGANESILLMRRAHALNVGEHPSLDTELHGTGENGGYNLTPEHGARRNFHVVTEFEIAGEVESLSHRDITPGFEHHHGDGVARESVSDDKFCDDVETDLLVRDSLNHADGDDVHEGNDEGKHECPDRHLSMEHFDDDDTKDKHRYENAGVPPLGNLRIDTHKTSVNIWLFTERASTLNPDLLPEVKKSVHNGGRDRSE